MTLHSFVLSLATGPAPTVCIGATVAETTDARRMTMRLEWHDLPVLDIVRDNPAETLYAVLCSLITDFDDHMVTRVEFENRDQEAADDAS